MVQNWISTIRKKIEKTKTLGVKTYATKQTMGHLLKKSKRKKKDTWKYMKMGTQYSKIYEAQQRQLLQLSL